MMTPEKQKEYEEQKAREFLTKLAKLVSDYRTEVSMGHVLGGLEIVKLRLFHEACVAADKELKKGQE